MSSIDELVAAAKNFLKKTWNEDTISMKITKNEVIDGSGKLHTDCVVKLGNTTSKWHKIFTFKNGTVVDEDYYLL